MVNLRSVKANMVHIKNIQLIGSNAKVEWKWNDDELQVKVPEQKVDDRAVKAVAPKISLK